jgi:hypothetical protein
MGFTHDCFEVHACEVKGNFMTIGIMNLTATLEQIFRLMMDLSVFGILRNWDFMGLQ